VSAQTSIRDQPLFTELIQDPSAFRLEEGDTFVSSVTAETRSHHVSDLQRRCPAARYVDVSGPVDNTVGWTDGVRIGSVQTRSPRQIESFWSEISLAGRTYLDITGLSHPVWAPFVAAGLRSGVGLKAVYVEPIRYRRNSISTATELFDLSKGFGGVSPLPGFASLVEPDDDNFDFVPLLGFEGRRFSYMMAEVAPVGGHVIPIVGVPGFQPEFVSYAYDGNQIPLEDSEAWQRVRFATANCPFSLFYELRSIASRHPGRHLKVAPIGTKPHGLGAVLYVLAHPEAAELIYDHPLRSERRTDGAARLLVYDIAGLAASEGIGAI
jgi:hypothetical protein